MSKIFWGALVSIVALASPLGAEIFYVCKGGSGTAPELSDCATAWSADDFNDASNWASVLADDGKIGPNDTVVVLDDGGTFREQFTIQQQSGLPGSPISIRGEPEGDPTISGANVVSGWNSEMGNVWSAALPTEAKTVLFDGIWGVKEIGVCPDDLNVDQEWCWDSGTLYQYSISDPDSRYASPGTEAGKRPYAIDLINASYVTIDGLVFEGANASGVLLYNASGHDTIKNSEMRFNGGQGCAIYDDALPSDLGGGFVVQDNLIHHNQTNGLSSIRHDGSDLGTETYFQRNSIHHNIESGITVWGNYHIIQDNVVYDNGVPASNEIGIHLYASSPTDGTGDHNIVRRNKVWGTLGSAPDGSGILSDQWCDHNEIYNNIVFGNSGDGVGVYDAQYINIYNNTLYKNGQSGADGEIEIKGSVSENRTSNVDIKNNITYGAEIAAIYVRTETTNNADIIIEHNLWFTDRTENWYVWGNATGNTLAGWQMASGQGANDKNSDPRFRDSANHDFHLTSASPAINAGVDVGLTEDYDGEIIPIGVLPDMGAFEFSGGPFLLSEPYPLDAAQPDEFIIVVNGVEYIVAAQINTDGQRYLLFDLSGKLQAGKDAAVIKARNKYGESAEVGLEFWAEPPSPPEVILVPWN